ncbi:MAG: hypothetical protein Q7V62_05320, partial [Actinomycetota bacterium]|nr:hypothetical protein [Actinomycetota bacterium]
VELKIGDSAAVVQSALNGVGAIATDGGVTVQTLSLAVSKVTAGNAATQEVQNLFRDSFGAGEFRLSYLGEQTELIASNATATEIELALNKLSTVMGSGMLDVKVADANNAAGTPTNPWKITFRENGDRADLVVVLTEEGTESNPWVVSFTGTVAVSTVVPGTLVTPEIQQLVVKAGGGAAGGGSFALTYLNAAGAYVTTGPISWNGDDNTLAANIDAALTAAGIPADVAVAGVDTFSITYTDNGNQSPLVADVSHLYFNTVDQEQISTAKKITGASSLLDMSDLSVLVEKTDADGNKYLVQERASDLTQGTIANQWDGALFASVTGSAAEQYLTLRGDITVPLTVPVV